jgi:hypothetical protein
MGAPETRFLKVCPDELALHRSWLALRMDFTEYGANFHISAPSSTIDLAEVGAAFGHRPGAVDSDPYGTVRLSCIRPNQQASR